MFRRFARLAVIPTALAALFVAAPDLAFAADVDPSAAPRSERPPAERASPTSETSPMPTPADAAEPATQTPLPEADATGKASERIGEAQEAPSPRPAPAPSQGPQPETAKTAGACPEGWVPVASEDNRSTDGLDNCERVAGAPSSGQRPLLSWPAAALAVTLGLLIFAIGLGATTRGRS